jgi:hypothetical protein
MEVNDEGVLPAAISINDGKVDVVAQTDVGTARNAVASAAQVEVVSLRPGVTLAGDGLSVDDNLFFALPVRIATFNWTDGAGTSNWYPWALWANDPMVAARLKGRSYVRGTLCLRFDIAASPYQYGLLRMGFRYGPDFITPTVDLTHSRTSVSQMLGVDLDASRPGSHVLKLPFIFPYDYLSVVSNQTSLFSDTTHALTDWRIMGKLFASALANLGHANSASSGTAVVRIYAWMENMESRGATRYNVVAQSGTVSGVAAQVSGQLARLSKVPVLGGAASSASHVARAVSELATAFGFSRVREDGASRTVIAPGSSYALTDAPFYGATLALTSKRAIGDAGGQLGVGEEDDMALMRIFATPSFLKAISWATTDTAGTVLASWPVDPMLSFVSGGTSVTPTSLAGATLAFRYWRGTIVFRFLVVCSGFHSGSVRISFDPGVRLSGTEDATWPVGALENVLLEATPGACVDVAVGHSAREHWLVVHRGFNNFDNFGRACVGKIVVTVENPLQAPLSTSGATIIPYIWAGEDYQVFGPVMAMDAVGRPWGGTATLTAQSDGIDGGDFFEGQSGIVNAQTPCKMVRFGGAPAPPDLMTDNIFGERVSSLRALLKRFSYLAALTATDGSPTSTNYKTCTYAFPLYPPTMDVRSSPNVGGTLFTYGRNTTVFRHFRMGFAGMRGGMRFIVRDAMPVQLTADGFFETGLACRVRTMTTYPGQYTAATNAAGFTANQGSFGDGSAFFQTLGDVPVEFEVPDYCNFSFHYAGNGGAGLPATGDLPIVEWPVIDLTKLVRDGSQQTYYLHCAAADDFSFVHWQGFPDLYLMDA